MTLTRLGKFPHGNGVPVLVGKQLKQPKLQQQRPLRRLRQLLRLHREVGPFPGLFRGATCRGRGGRGRYSLC